LRKNELSEGQKREVRPLALENYPSARSLFAVMKEWDTLAMKSKKRKGSN